MLTDELEYKNIVRAIDIIENRLFVVITNRNDLDYINKKETEIKKANININTTTSLFTDLNNNNNNNNDVQYPNYIRPSTSTSSMKSINKPNKKIIKKTVTISLSTNQSTELTNQWNNEIFPIKGITLYFKLLGDLYYNLYQKIMKKSMNSLRSQLILSEYMNRFTKSYKLCVMISEKSLNITTHLRLQCIYYYCKILIEIKGQLHRSRHLLTRTLTNASSYNNNNYLDSYSIRVLESIRQLLLDSTINLTIRSPTSYNFNNKLNDKLVDKEKHKGNDKEKCLWDLFIDLVISDEESIDSNQIITLTNEQTKQLLHPIVTKKKTKSLHKPIDPLLELIRHFRLIFYLPTPILLDDMPSASEILKALDRIFRIYVRGNSLSGQRIDGNTVSIDNGHNTLSISNFLLSGPYLSWHGFISILSDFNISKQKTTKPSKRLIDEETISSPIKYKEAAMIFIECSRTNAPVLTLNKYISVYDEIAKKIVIDPWSDVYDWAVSDDWDIKAGINFMQFIDCLGKYGIIAYSEDRFSSIFPSANEKIEHFLSAHLGLTDYRKWEKTVDKKQKYTKELVKGLISSNSMRSISSNVEKQVV